MVDKTNLIKIITLMLIMILALTIGVFVENTKERNYPLGYVLSKDEKIMVLKYPDSLLMNNLIPGILPPGAKYTFVLPSDVEKINLKEYDLILIPSHFFDFENKYDPSFLSKINDYVENGGLLIVLLQYNYDWLDTPIKFEKRLVTSVTLGNINHSFFNKIQNAPIPETHVIQAIKNLEASQAGDGFVYPAYGVFSNYSGESIILDRATQKPILINMTAGSGRILLTTSPWDYHFYRTDISDNFAFEEAIFYYYSILWILDSHQLLVAYMVQPIGMWILLISIFFAFITADFVLDYYNKEVIKKSTIFIIIIGVFASIFTGLLYSEMNTYYDKVYQTDKNFDGLPDQSTNIIDMDGLVSDFEKAKKYHYLYSIFLYLSILALPFGAVAHLVKGWFDKHEWGPQIILTITFTLVFLLVGLIIFYII